MTIVCVLGAVAFGGCNSYNLRYEAMPQPDGKHLYADYNQLQDAVSIAVDTDGERLEDIYIKLGDGSKVYPVNINYPGFARSGALGTGLGAFTGHVGFGTGIGAPVGPEEAQGVTTATFLSNKIGTPPWEVHVTVHGAGEAVIPGVGGKPTAK
jgi:hypothetical protein